MADYLKRFLGSSSFRALDARDRIKINRVIRHCEVTINLGDSDPAMHRKIGVGLTELSARDYTFELDDGSGVRRISIEVSTEAGRLTVPSKLYPSGLLQEAPWHIIEGASASLRRDSQGHGLPHRAREPEAGALAKISPNF